jgi:hypothetical protein
MQDEWKAALRLRSPSSVAASPVGFLERSPADGMPLPLT